MAMNLTQGAAREQIDATDVSKLRNAGVLVEDPRRERPRYFDGRFLSARDLIRDQQYFLTREADLGRAAGSGVANGLFVTPGGTPQSLNVSGGQGVTPAGELVLLPNTIHVNLADVPVADQLSAKFGLSRIPVAPLRSRTGLFVLALRPVEFTANPIGAYPTTLTGPRTVEDGDVIEATALVLVPWNEDGAADTLEARRGRAARVIFTQGTRNIASANVLPIAMLALQSNTIVWIDEALVRRELGADRGDLPGLGFAPRALRLAHLLQHQTHLADVVAQMHGRTFPAATQFPALPPAGPLPAGCINTADFTQRYFPAEVDVDFSIIPDDELPALIEEALALPPIDFLADAAVLDLTAVMILAPIPRNEWRAELAKLETRSRSLKPAAPNLIAQRKPLEILQRLRLPLPLTVTPDVSNPADAEWARLAKLSNLWFVRRRNLAYRDDLAGAPVAVAGKSEAIVEASIKSRIGTLGLASTLDKVLASATAQAAPRVLNLLASPRIAASPALTAATLGALSEKISAGAALDHATVLGVAAEMTAPGAGDGLARLEQSSSAGVAKASLLNLASSGAWRKLDASAAIASDAAVPQLAARLTPLSAIKAAPVAAPVVEKAPAKSVAKPVTKTAKASAAKTVEPTPKVAPVSPATSSKLAASAVKGAAKSLKPKTVAKAKTTKAVAKKVTK
ncbi:MAG: hypothetical protein JWL63_2259 [Rhodocyclales bacterium]|nr:hypothetical protein [Rhodocyclales bacterium]